jgi:hypothetical protein
MADRSSPDYFGTHWGVMDGWPFNHDVFLLARYPAGVYPPAPGWRVVRIEPVLADLDYVECSLDSVASRVQISVILEADRFER